MAVAEKRQTPLTPGAPVVQLRARPKGDSLWNDAWRRLRRNRLAVMGGVIIIAAVLGAIFAPALAPRDPFYQILPDGDTVPQWVADVLALDTVERGGYVQINNAYPLGADHLGRDLLSRILYGSRVSLMVAFVGPLVSLLVGVTYGLISGYAGGRVDNLMMRIVDIMYAFPTLLLVILLMAYFRSSFAQTSPGSFAFEVGRLDRAWGGMLFIVIGIGITSWMGLARLVRGQILSVREKEYIEAARAIGTGTRGIMFRHMLPNILGTLIVTETLTIPRYIAYEAFLSFIGLGVNLPTPSWGGMIAEGSDLIGTYPSQALFPALALFLVMFAFNFLGDGLRDALDPRMRGVD